MDNAIVDVTKALLDLSYQGIEDFHLDVPSEHVKALVLTGNQLSDFQFLTMLPGLTLFHGDSMGIEGFDVLPFQKVPQLKHAILRNNRLRDLRFLPECDTLELFDVSLNDFAAGAEQQIAQAYPALRTVVFGQISDFIPSKTLMTCSTTNLNSFTLFSKLFVERFYEPEKVAHQIILDPRVAVTEFQGLQFVIQLQTSRIRVQAKKLPNTGEVRNCKLIITVYNCHTGFELSEEKQQVVQLAQIVGDSRVDVPYKKVHQPTEYPTQSGANLEDLERFSRLQRVYHLQNQYQNFKFFTVEYQGAVGLYFFDLSGFLDFRAYEEKHDREIKLRKGVRVTVNRNMSSFNAEQQMMQTQSLAGADGVTNVLSYSGQRGQVESAQDWRPCASTRSVQTAFQPALSEPRPVEDTVVDLTGGQLQDTVPPWESTPYEMASQNQRPALEPAMPLLFQSLRVRIPANMRAQGADVAYYTTKLDKSGIMSYAATLIPDLAGGAPLLDRLVRRTIQAQNNAQSTRMIVYNQQAFIYVNMAHMDRQVPMKLELDYLTTAPADRALALNEDVLNRYVVASYGGALVLVTEDVVRFVPRIDKLELRFDDRVLEAVVYKKQFHQNAPGPTSLQYRFCFYQNNVLLYQGPNNKIRLQGPLEGMYKATVQMCDEQDMSVGREVESDVMFVRANGTVGGDRQHGPALQQALDGNSDEYLDIPNE